MFGQELSVDVSIVAAEPGFGIIVAAVARIIQKELMVVFESPASAHRAPAKGIGSHPKTIEVTDPIIGALIADGGGFVFDGDGGSQWRVEPNGSPGAYINVQLPVNNADRTLWGIL